MPDILSMYFRGNENITQNINQYLQRHKSLNISIITYYEILSGLKHRSANKQLASFLKFISQNKVLPVSIKSMDISAEKYATLRQKGTPVDDIDLLIAGVAIANNLVMVTNNSKHFSKIEGLEILNWSKV